MGWRKEGGAALGWRSPNSEMPNWYDRAVRNTELHWRGEITNRVQGRWRPRGDFEIPKKESYLEEAHS